jgi:hypothetical protein
MNTWKHALLWAPGVLVELVPVLGLMIWRLVRMFTSDDPAIWARQIATFKKQDRRHLPQAQLVDRSATCISGTVHPSAKGYALWTSIIKPTLQADLFKRAEVIQG